MQRLKRNGVFGVGVLAAAIGTACSAGDATGPAYRGEPISGASQAESVEALALVEALRERFPFPSFSAPVTREGAFLRPELPPPASRALARGAEVRLPIRANGAFQVRDTGTAMAIEVGLVGAKDAPAEMADGFVVYRRAAADGGDIIHRPSAGGTEDYVYLKNPPAEEVLRYDVVLDDHVAGLRLVSNTLEFLDTGGAPRLRMAPPWGVDARGKRFAAAVTIKGCPYDADPRGPWGRPVVAPGAARCAVQVQWDGADARYPLLVDPTWMSTTDMTAARHVHTASVLSDGKVLVAGGGDAAIGWHSTAELYDPGTNTWAMTAAMSATRGWHSATVLADGKILIAGGWNGANPLSGAETYDPATGMWSPTTSPMGAGRYVHTATRFMDVDMRHKVLVVGGSDSGMALDTAEIYDPDTGLWSPTMAPLSIAREFHTDSLLANGKVLIAAGRIPGGALNSATVYDPATRTWTDTGPMAFARHNHTASVLQNGRVVVVGGSTAIDDSLPIQSAEVYDPLQNQWSDAGNMNEARVLHTASLLPSGKLLVTGGTNGITLNGAEIYDPIQNVWSAVQSMSTPRYDHTASLLPGGKVLVAGGVDLATSTKSAELFLLLPGDACTAALDCASVFCADGVCCDTACTNPCEACDGVIPGTCSLVTGAPHPDPSRPPCEGDDSDCGHCDGTSLACVYPELTPCHASCAGGSQIVSLCDGRGACKPFSTPIPCAPYACSDTTGCATSCMGNSECAPGFQCSIGSACVAGSAMCIDNQTLQNGGEQIDCTPYRCAGNACLQTCTSVDDCIAPHVCDATSKQCIAPGAPGPGQTGCTCSTPGPAGPPSPRWLAAIAVAAMMRRSRTPRRMKR